MHLNSLDLLDLIRPKLEALAEHGVTDQTDADQQSLVKLMAKKYLEALSNPPLPHDAPVPIPSRGVRPKSQGMPTKERQAGRMSLQERIARTRGAAREAKDEMTDEGGFADESIPTPSASLPDPRAIQYDETTGQPLCPSSSLRLPRE